MNVTGPKGTGISTANLAAACGLTATCLADTETKVEVFEDARLSLDASKVFWGNGRHLGHLRGLSVLVQQVRHRP